ncbi:MAG TPA: MarR family transcriptional regulator [Acidimicrobiia bacterium]|nr:MarR family transcriptional regulator [Acidimicrobiia bacterium]
MTGRRKASDDVALVRDGVRREFPDLDADAAATLLTTVRAARHVAAWVQSTLKPLGLNDSDAVVLVALSLAGPPHAMTATRLNEALVVTSGGITRTVDRLAARRLVSRARDADDARRVQVTLTARGRRTAADVLGSLLDAFGERGGSERLDSALPALSRVVDAFGDVRPAR